MQKYFSNRFIKIFLRWFIQSKNIKNIGNCIVFLGIYPCVFSFLLFPRAFGALVCVCVCVCVRQSTVKASSLWIRGDTMEQINDVMLKRLISYDKSIKRYCRVQYLTFLTSRLVYARTPYFPASRTDCICIGLFWNNTLATPSPLRRGQ